VKAKHAAGEYNSHEEVKADIMLTFDNAVNFNGDVGLDGHASHVIHCSIT